MKLLMIAVWQVSIDKSVPATPFEVLPGLPIAGYDSGEFR
jgi:hypothetical protein